jgi:UDP:flavonoid glycosyltransferase YjiC (YdhE family)
VHIVLATYGSRGDVQPMLALALGLNEAGHRVTLIASPENRAWIEDEGCAFKPLGSDVLSFIHRQTDAHTIRCAFHFNTFVRQGLKQQLEGLAGLTGFHGGFHGLRIYRTSIYIKC